MSSYTSQPRSTLFQGQLQIPDKFIVNVKVRLFVSGATIQFYGIDETGTIQQLTAGAIALNLGSAADEQRRYEAKVIEPSLFPIVSYYYTIANVEEVIELPNITLVNKHAMNIGTTLTEAAGNPASTPIYKSRLFPMVFEGMIQVIDKVVITHKNNDAADTPCIIVIGLEGQGVSGSLQYHLCGVEETALANPSPAPVGWYRLVTADAGLTLDNLGWTIGETFYLETEIPVLAAGDELVPVKPLKLHTGVLRTASVLDMTFHPAETVFYWIHDADHIQNLYDMQFVMKTTVNVSEGEA